MTTRSPPGVRMMACIFRGQQRCPPEAIFPLKKAMLIYHPYWRGLRINAALVAEDSDARAACFFGPTTVIAVAWKSQQREM